MTHRRFAAAAATAIALAACTNGGNATAQSSPETSADAPDGAEQVSFETAEMGQFEQPWAMTFLPDGRLLVTQQQGQLILWDGESATPVAGTPQVDYGGQGGLGDVVLHPDFAENGIVYLSFAEAGEGDTRGAAVGRGRLVLDGDSPRIEGWTVIWRQSEKVSGRGHYGHRIAFSNDGHLFISSGERQKFDPAQNMENNLGSIVRLNDDGSVPEDNPFFDRGGATAQIWSYGHRNPLGLAFAPDGRLWEHEMGPRGGDELNLIERGDNYGYPIVSNGDHYDGRDIPDHDTRPEFNAPEASWTPVISPAGFIIYTGDAFPAWRGSGFIGGLSSQALIRVTFDGDQGREAERWDMGQRIREVEQGPDGAIWVLEDQEEPGGSGGRLLKLTPES